MGAIQSSINSMIGSAAGAVRAVKGFQALKQKQVAQQAKQPAKTQVPMKGSSPQAQAAKKAQQSADNAIQAKRAQRKKIDEMKTSWGGSVKDLPENIRESIYKEYENGIDKPSKR